MSPPPSPIPPRHLSRADLVRAMVKADSLETGHVRSVVAHTVDQRGVLDLLLEEPVVEGLIGLDIHQLATVEAFTCHLLGTGFHALTFSMRAHPDNAIGLTETLTPVAPGPSAQALVPDVTTTLAPASFARFDAPRTSSSVFDGTCNEEFLVQLPDLDESAGPAEPAEPATDRRVSFRDCALHLAHLTTGLDRPFSFIHAPSAAPATHVVPRGLTGPCVRVGVAFPHFDHRLRLRFGTDLVDLCCREGYGLWQGGAIAGMAEHDYWRPIVRLPAPAERRPTPSYALDGSHGDGGDHALAVTCVGAATPGATEAILDVLEQAGAPLGALAETTLDDMRVIHLMTRTRLDPGQVAAVDQAQRADVTVGQALGMTDPPTNDRLRHVRALVSTRVETTPSPDLVAIWMAWATPAVPTALRLTVRTLRDALDAVSARYRSDAGAGDDRHLNIEYLVGREVSDDWLRGRIKVSVDRRTLGGPGCGPHDPVATAELGRFCSLVERQWRSLLGLALDTANIGLEVVWRESWLGRWSSVHVDPHDEH